MHKSTLVLLAMAFCFMALPDVAFGNFNASNFTGNSIQSNASYGGQVRSNGQTYDVYYQAGYGNGFQGPSIATRAVQGSDSHDALGSGGPSAPTCATRPDLRTPNIAFVNPGGSLGSALNQDALETGVTYDILIEINNFGCEPTSDPTYHLNDPRGNGGRFPVLVEIDFGSNGVDVTRTLNNQGPVGGYNASNNTDRIVVRIPNITMSQSGNHTVRVVADPLEADNPSAACAGVHGCIDETNDATAQNSRSETFRSNNARVELGSFLWAGPHIYVTGTNAWVSNTYAVASKGHRSIHYLDNDNRFLTIGMPLANGLAREYRHAGIYWTGNLINYNSCTGVSSRNDTISLPASEFNGQPDRPGMIMSGGSYSSGIGFVGPSNLNMSERFDMYLTEPNPGEYHRYTITCQSVNGTTVTDNIVISRTNAVPPPPVTPSGPITPVTPVTPQCSDSTDNDGDGYNNQNDPGCHTDQDTTDGDPTYDPNDNDEDNVLTPTITANPSVIRQGATTTIFWNPNGYSGCVLAPQSLFAGANASTPGLVDLSVSVQANLSITCGNLSDSIEIRVIPNIFET